MIYGVKQITKHDMSGYVRTGYKKTDRGWENWCYKDITDINEAYRQLIVFDNCVDKDTYYIVEEVL